VKSSRTTVVCFVLCLLGLALTYNRYLVLRQFPSPVSTPTGYHLPLDEATPVHAGGRRLFVALPNEETLDAPQLARAAISNLADPTIPLCDAPFTSLLQTDPSSRAPSYILQSVLNL
jgi:hypothetical protein